MDVTAKSRIGRAVQKVAGSAVFAKVAPPIVTTMDRVVYKLSGGRMILSRGVVPTLMLTTTGRKSGEPRLVPLATMPVDGGLLVVASNFGREKHPAWSANLMQEPKATVTFKGETYPVTARLLNEEEKKAVWPELLKMWPNYDRYSERSGRDLRVFELVRAAG